MDDSIRETVRGRLERLLRALDGEDLEERVAPVKCAKHPDSPECESADYAVPFYMAPPGDATPSDPPSD